MNISDYNNLCVEQNLFALARMSRIRVPLAPATAMSDESTCENMTDQIELDWFFASTPRTE